MQIIVTSHLQRINGSACAALSKKFNKNISHYSVKVISFRGGTIFHTADMSLIYLPPFWYAPHVLLCKLCTQIKSSIPIVLTMNRERLQWFLDSRRQKKIYKIKSYAHRSNKWQRRQCLISAVLKLLAGSCIIFENNRRIHNLSLLMIDTGLSNLRYDVLSNNLVHTVWEIQYAKWHNY